MKHSGTCLRFRVLLSSLFTTKADIEPGEEQEVIGVWRTADGEAESRCWIPVYEWLFVLGPGNPPLSDPSCPTHTQSGLPGSLPPPGHYLYIWLLAGLGQRGKRQATHMTEASRFEHFSLGPQQATHSATPQSPGRLILQVSLVTARDRRSVYPSRL